jgi:hypothetical protein
MKSTSVRLSKVEKNVKIRKAALTVVALMQRSTSLGQASDMYRNIYFIFSQEHCTDEVETAITELLDSATPNAIQKYTLTDALLNVAEVDVKISANATTKAITSSSPFAIHFRKLRQTLSDNSRPTSDSDTNLNVQKAINFIHLHVLK